jgi:UDPglucose--hexose-1-phosphate uridylyltransferase
LETWVLPKRHESHYENEPGKAIAELSIFLRQVITAIDDVGRRPAYNYLIHTAPFDTASATHYHWHIEIIPILSKTAGFEWASGYYVNPLPPEQAAEWLRTSYSQYGVGEKSSLE